MVDNVITHRRDRTAVWRDQDSVWKVCSGHRESAGILRRVRQSSQVCQMRVPKSQGRERELQTLHLQLHLQTQAQVLQLLQQVSPC